MKTIKRVALKEATILSQEEMKLIFGGGSLSLGQLIENTCKVGVKCFLNYQSGLTMTGTCQGRYSEGSVGCFCSVSGAKPYVLSGLSHSFKGN